jgi:hypothetical protein
MAEALEISAPSVSALLAAADDRDAELRAAVARIVEDYENDD